MGDNVNRPLTCLTCGVAFSDNNEGRSHYQSDWHRSNLKRKVTHMELLSAEEYEKHTAATKLQEDSKKESKTFFCKLCKKHFNSQNNLDGHMRSKKHRENASAKSVGVQKSEMVIVSNSKKSRIVKMDVESDEGEESDVESWGDEDLLGLEECLFCRHVSSSLENNISHMTDAHSFFLPDAEYICDLEGLVVYLGEMISQGHMCLWCHQRSRVFGTVEDVQKHMVDKGHCMIKHDDTTRHEYADFYDYRSSYPDADQADSRENADSVDPEILVGSGFQLALPSGSTIGHRSLACYYKQNLGGRRQVTKSRTVLSKVLAGSRALGWTGSTDLAIRQARDLQFLQRMKTRYQLKLGMRANKMQFHYREQNPK